MNRIGAHALMWVGGWSEQECRQAIENSRATSYDLIEISVLDPSSIDVAMTREVLEEAGLSAACSLGLTFETDISSTDPEVVARGERLLHDALAVTRDLGAQYLGGVIFSALGKYTDPPGKHGRANSVRVIQYQGPVTFESFSSAVTTPRLSRSLPLWRNNWTGRLDLGRHAPEVIDAGPRGAEGAPPGAPGGRGAEEV